VAADQGAVDWRWVTLGPIRLQVAPGVFAPQPDTLAVIDWCDRLLGALPTPVVVDLCTGSGVIALALAARHPGARIHAVDSSAAAVRSARANADRLARESGARIEVRRGDATDPSVLADIAGTADLVVANPPYLPDGSPAPPELAASAEPAALFGGPDGLDVIRGVVAVAAVTLRPGGWLAVEHAAGQRESVAALLEPAGAFDSVTGHRDHAGIWRFATARRVAAGPPTRFHL
jgi:release factor glutamine methyltransferase